MKVREVVSGAKIRVRVLPVIGSELKNYSPMTGWNFDWKLEKKYEIFKLVREDDETGAIGLMSLINGEGGDYIEVMHLESGPGNIGRKKKYEFIAGIMMAYACQLSFERGFQGWIAFESKTRLKKHYEKEYGAKDTGMRCMYLDTPAAHKMISNYLFPGL